MGTINEKTVLDFYLEQIEKDGIEFLKDKPWYKKRISKEIINLRDEAEMNSKITICKRLWKVLFEASMSFIDPDRRGYDDLFSYFDEYVNFEELIFASDSFYRDHTMHCLWVYFLGEYIIKKKEFEPFFHNYRTEFDSVKQILDIVKEKNYTNIFSSWLNFDDLFESYYKCADSSRCLEALTHDLGYPIKKINSINKNIKNILPHFGIKNLSEFEFTYSDIHDNFIKDFLNLLSYRLCYRIGEDIPENKISKTVLLTNKEHAFIGLNEENLLSLTDNEKDIYRNMISPKKRIVFDYSSHMRYSKDFENYQHGIMSAFLLFRKLSAFKNKDFMYMDLQTVDMSSSEFNKIRIIIQILMAITDHNSDEFEIKSIYDDSSFLTFVDELEEFSRISRANQNRQYINEFCKSSIYVNNEYLNIDFTFDNKQIDNLDPERAFKDKCKRFLTLFNINELDEKLKLKIRYIGNLSYNKNVYMLELRNKFVNITINGEEKNIPEYLSSAQFLTKEEYMLS